MTTSNIAGLESLFLALSDKTRLKLLALMADGEVSVGYLAETIGESQPKTSRHLAYLRNVGLVSTRRDGKWIYYGLQDHLEPAAFAILAATLRSMGSELQLSRQPAESRDAYDAHSTPESYDIYGNDDMSEWHPNEMEVYLL